MSRPTITLTVEPCDVCHEAYSEALLTPVRDVDGHHHLRCPKCLEALREELRDLGLAG